MAGLTLTYQAMGRTDDADATLGLLFGFAQARTDTSSLRLAEALRARLRLSREGAADTVVAATEPPDPEPMFLWLVNPVVSACRTLLAEGSPGSLETANAKLRQCLELNERLHNVRQTIEVLPLLALVRQKQGREGDALGLIERAVTLAAPGGWIRAFVDPGPAVADLLRRLSPRVSVESDFVRRVLGAFEKAATAPVETTDRGGPGAASGPAFSQAALGPDALTDREHEILTLLAARLQNKEIAAKLYISTHTVNDHLKHIYQKLVASNRRQAVARARELGLLVDERSSGNPPVA